MSRNDHEHSGLQPEITHVAGRDIRAQPGVNFQDHADGYRPRRPIGLPSASASTHTRTSGATWRGAPR
jgi:hypothetical protein